MIDKLTIEVDEVALYWGMALERLDYYVYHLCFMTHERYLDTICKYVGSKVVIIRPLYQVFQSNLFFF